MPGVRRLWTGPYGSALRDRALQDGAVEPSGVWIAPSPMARDQVRRLLGLRLEGGVGRRLRVWCWGDLWRAIRDERPNGPAWLSEAAARAALGEAIARARGDGALEGFAELIEWPGFRRRLRTRMAAWTRVERPIDAGPPGQDPMLGAHWNIFVRYRAILRTLDAEDEDGFATWASRTLVDSPPPSLKRPGAVTFLDLEDDTPAVRRVLEHAHSRARSVRVTLAHVDGEGLAGAYSTVAPIRRCLLEWGFTEVQERHEIMRPAGLVGVECELFRSDVHQPHRLSSTNGLTVIGAPQGVGGGLVLAREVAQRLEEGADPEDLLVLFRRWDDDASLVLETLRSWGLPVVAEVRRPLASEPAISALRLAMKLPLDDWESSRLVQLLRHGQVRPQWPEARTPQALAQTAAKVHASRVFRGRDALRMALERAIGEELEYDRKAERSRLARDVLERLIGLLEPLARPGRWPEQTRRLHLLAEGLQLGSPGDTALDTLWAALDDQGAVLDDLGWGRRTWSWFDFTAEVESLVGDLDIPAPQAPGGRVRLAAIDEVAGARAAHVLVGNLAEGTFPVREAVEADLDRTPDSEDPGRPDPAFAREMLRFLRVVGSAETSLVLVHPTTDPQGQELLKAGFLEDLLQLFDAGAIASFPKGYRRIDPALIGSPELARAPADARVRAVALACSDRDPSGLAVLARSPSHRPVLDGTASALVLTHHRARNRSFDHYDGRLSDPGALGAIAAKFGAEYLFSPSQLESYLFCPFQFYLRYVLKQQPVDERDELDEDYTERGSRVHRVLELLEQLHTQDGTTTSRLELARQVIENQMRAEPADGSAVAAGLHQIDQKRLERAVERYVRQHDLYEQLDPALRPVPHLFETVFGHEDNDPASYPSLSLGDSTMTVRLQGKIDRIDLLPSAEKPGFRIIDYKTGPSPSKKDVKESLYLQLPLYALAVERLVLATQAGLHDVGYWGLSKDGYKPIAFPAWDEDQARLEAFVIDLVNHLRHGVFPIDPRKDDCTKRCEYNAVCRIGQVRAHGKRREDELRIELKIR